MAIGDLKTRLRAKFSRRSSTASSLSSVDVDGEVSDQTHNNSPSHKLLTATPRARSIRSRGSPTQGKRPASTLGGITIDEGTEDAGLGEGEQLQLYGEDGGVPLNAGSGSDHLRESMTTTSTTAAAAATTPISKSKPPPACDRKSPDEQNKHDSTSTDFPTPNTDIGIPAVPEEDSEEADNTNNNKETQQQQRKGSHIDFTFSRASTSPSAACQPLPLPSPSPSRPTELPRRQSLLPHQQTRLIKTLLETELPPTARASNNHHDYFAHIGPSTISANMVSRKIWVKRPGASATLVTIHEDDLVDDVKDMILKKYANSMGRNFDAPDLTLRICPREQMQERTLGPEEPMGRTLDAYFPGGQTVDEALVIDVPLRRTPKPSPQAGRGHYDDGRPLEGGSDYFPPMPAAVPAIPSPLVANSVPVNGQGSSHHSSLTTHSMSVLSTGHVPALPSPGSRRSHTHHRPDRPRIGRQHTSSPVILGSQATGSNEQSSIPSAPSPLPTPPPAPQPELAQIQRVATPPPRVSSPRPRNVGRKRSRKVNGEHPSLPTGMLNGAVPPINVLIVEDNIINLKLLEAFMKRLKVRWQTAMNGKEAVTKWRAGGFHLVLMDIQLPIMSGLEATKEIRRLESLNSIGVFSSSASSSAPSQGESLDEPEGEDKLPSTVHFKSPVIIVALTASSLQSDRHEALAAGCNDFLTKPVNFVWLERKVMEWGCMQALIDFDGWRKWKDFSQKKTAEAEAGEDKKSALGAGGKGKGKKGNRVHSRTPSGANGGGGDNRVKEKGEKA
ncbi:uncharacterized protein BP5553_01464 [Venustampulla echinocandica]|uniref:Response regulatory domain-containing protein n=1 Tax=Venustampulla echinocandica TaxID=2656787 RepID=A0A370U149_9HELO|nr:uncharacterized protein BP5553_01464 [Venustampulla echinocandica]RDL41485.1 hypothetical protein BP5553_01464 [Venustampulla echinocandica]